MKRDHCKHEKILEHMATLKFHKLKYCSGNSGDMAD